MDKNKKKVQHPDEEKLNNDFAPEIADDLEEIADNTEAEPDEVETLTSQLEATQAALDKEKKEYLFLMAEFDNYRKRVTKEKAEIIKNGAEKVLAGLLPIVDDF